MVLPGATLPFRIWMWPVAYAIMCNLEHVPPMLVLKSKGLMSESNGFDVRK
jgi:hypothetical protein